MEINCMGSASEIYSKLKTRIEDLRSRGKLSIISEVQFNDDSKTATAKGTGFDANISCVENKIQVELKLGFLLKPMRHTIEEGLRKRLEDAMA